MYWWQLAHVRSSNWHSWSRYCGWLRRSCFCSTVLMGREATLIKCHIPGQFDRVGLAIPELIAFRARSQGISHPICDACQQVHACRLCSQIHTDMQCQELYHYSRPYKESATLGHGWECGYICALQIQLQIPKSHKTSQQCAAWLTPYP